MSQNSATSKALRCMVMEPRPDWNRLGPRLPAWFRPRLKRLDPKLVMQFMPPASHVEPDGVDPLQYPNGVWVICRKLPGSSGWLFKRWTWNLADSFGRHQTPGTDTIDLLRMAKRSYRNGGGEILEDQFAASVDAMRRESISASKERLANRVAAICRIHNMSVGQNHIFMRDSVVERN